MRGRTQLNWREFRGSGHLGFFHHVVGLLSLLQPGLFQEDGKAVNGIMEAFFTVLQVGFRRSAKINLIWNEVDVMGV